MGVTSENVAAAYNITRRAQVRALFCQPTCWCAYHVCGLELCLLACLLCAICAVLPILAKPCTVLWTTHPAAEILFM